MAGTFSRSIPTIDLCFDSLSGRLLQPRLQIPSFPVHQVYTQHGVELQEGACILDIGANIGLFTLFVVQKLQACTVHALEPLPPIYAVLQANVAALAPGGGERRVHTHNIGLVGPRTVDVSGVAWEGPLPAPSEGGAQARAAGTRAGDDPGDGTRRTWAADFTYYPRMPGNSTLYPALKDRQRPFMGSFTPSGLSTHTDHSAGGEAEPAGESPGHSGGSSGGCCSCSSGTVLEVGSGCDTRAVRQAGAQDSRGRPLKRSPNAAPIPDLDPTPDPTLHTRPISGPRAGLGRGTGPSRVHRPGPKAHPSADPTPSRPGRGSCPAHPGPPEPDPGPSVAEDFFTGQHPLTCTVTTLSHFLSTQGIAQVDLLKVDVEGAEEEVLRGVSPSHWGCIRQVSCETNSREAAIRVEALLRAQGFQVVVAGHPLSPMGMDAGHVYARRL